jgi:NTE family protein
MFFLRCWVLLAAACLAGCSTAHYFVNKPSTSGEGPPYTLLGLERGDNSDSLNVLVTMSGGGYRAAALAYAVLEVLNETEIVWEGRRKHLLEEVDIISGVSGGSLTAAYYVAFREDFFVRFERDVLGLDLQSAVAARFLSPSQLWAQSSKHYGRGDIFQQVLDEKVFRGITFGQLPRTRPMVFVNATEIHYGQRFEFTQDSFDHLCSDLSSFPVSRAVAASMAVPLFFSPITLWNHTASCPRVLQFALPAPSVDGSRFIHLMDGGLADNIGVRMPLELIAGHGGLLETTRRAGFRGVKKSVFLVINALPSPHIEDDDSSETPGLLRQFRAAVAVPIDRSSVDSLGLLHAAVDRWTGQLRVMPPERLQGVLDKDLQFHVIEVNLADVPADVEFDSIRRMATSLRISPQELSALRRYARRALEQDPEWRRLLQELESRR